MNEKTRSQIEEMKKQTIGVEVEMNSISRDKAARLAAEFFGTGRFENTAGRNGYYTWSAWDAEGREWKFQRDVSIAGPDNEKCELVTPILTYADIETLQELIRCLRKAGAKSDASRGCGVHIHIGAKGHTPQTLRNLANIMASHEMLLASALDLDRGRMHRYCRTVDQRFLDQLNRKKPSTMAQLADVWYGSQNANYGRSQHYNDSRYHMLNLHATFTKGTVEFRLFQFDEPADGKRNGLHAGQLKSYIQLCLALSQMAKMVRTASPKPQQTENPKYAMRTWLLRLGFIGEEFETARDILTRRLSG
ncbi:amidoligase family protein, partial [Neglectibacter timonensis]